MEIMNDASLMMRKVSDRCEYAQQARELMQAAHDACFKAKDRDVLGMSSGPFSGVNQVLGLIAMMDAKIAQQEIQIATLTTKDTPRA